MASLQFHEAKVKKRQLLKSSCYNLIFLLKCNALMSMKIVAVARAPVPVAHRGHHPNGTYVQLIYKYPGCHWQPDMLEKTERVK